MDYTQKSYVLLKIALTFQSFYNIYGQMTHKMKTIQKMTWIQCFLNPHKKNLDKYFCVSNRF